jgi:hypothetical protein
MATQIKTHPVVESAINLFGNWLKHRQEMRELREINSGDFARIAQELCVTPAELDTFVRQGPHASDELKAFEIPRHRRGDPVAHAASPAARHGTRLRRMPAEGQVRPRSRRRYRRPAL